MNTVTNFLSDAADFARSYARELLALLLIIAMLAGGSYLFRATEDNLAAQRAALKALTKPWAPTTSQQAASPCTVIYTEGTNSYCAVAGKDAR
ncbi:MAG: hypothetical protein WBW32_01395 [Luteibacter sp.]